MRIINRNDSKLSYMELKKKEEVIEFLQKEEYQPGHSLKRLDVEFNEFGDVIKFLVERYTLKVQAVGGVELVGNSDDLCSHSTTEKDAKLENTNGSCFKECLAGKDPYVKGLIHDIADRLKEVYGEKLPRELEQELDYIISQTYQATLRHYSAINC